MKWEAEITTIANGKIITWPRLSRVSCFLFLFHIYTAPHLCSPQTQEWFCMASFHILILWDEASENLRFALEWAANRNAKYSNYVGYSECLGWQVKLHRHFQTFTTEAVTEIPKFLLHGIVYHNRDDQMTRRGKPTYLPTKSLSTGKACAISLSNPAIVDVTLMIQRPVLPPLELNGTKYRSLIRAERTSWGQRWIYIKRCVKSSRQWTGHLKLVTWNLCSLFILPWLLLRLNKLTMY